MLDGIPVAVGIDGSGTATTSMQHSGALATTGSGTGVGSSGRTFAAADSNSAAGAMIAATSIDDVRRLLGN